MNNLESSIHNKTKGTEMNWLYLNYVRTPHVRINWDGEASEFAEKQDNWILHWKLATLAVWSLAVTIYNMYLRLNLSNTPGVQF